MNHQNKILYFRREKNIFSFNMYGTLGKNGGKEYDLWGKYIPPEDYQPDLGTASIKKHLIVADMSVNEGWGQPSVRNKIGFYFKTKRCRMFGKICILMKSFAKYIHWGMLFL